MSALPPKADIINDLLKAVGEVPLCAHLSERHWPRGAVKALKKFGGRPASRTDYHFLLGCLEIPTKAKAIQHARFLSPNIVQQLHELPNWLCLTNLVPFLDDPRVISKFEFHLGPAIDRAPPDLKRRIINSLKSVNTSVCLMERLTEWDLWILAKQPFPEPPLHGDSRLRPLSSVKAIRNEGRHMQNCLSRFAYAPLLGFGYFYQWLGKGRSREVV